MGEQVNQALLALLENERKAILSGEFSQLPAMVGRKEQLFNKLQQSHLTVPALRRIGAQVSHNQKLLAAALRGLREVSDRLNVVNELRNGFSTYDQQGQKSTVSAQRPGFEHKV